MQLKQDILFSKIFEKPTILICGGSVDVHGIEKEKIDGYVLDQLFSAFNESSRCLRLAILFSPSLLIRDYFKQSPLKEGKDYIFKGSIDEAKEINAVNAYINPLIGQGYNLMVCGFNLHPDESLAKLVHKLPLNYNNPYLFFTDKPTKETLDFWKANNAFVSENSGGLSGLIRFKSTDLIDFYQVESDFTEDHVIGLREEMVKRHQTSFKQSAQIYQIVGLKGIGKKSFVKELIYRKEIKSPVVIQIRENSSSETILLELFEQLRIPEATKTISIEQEHVFHKFNVRLKELESISLIFFGAENLLAGQDEVENNFWNSFFVNLIEHTLAIKVYLVSIQELFFKNRSIKSKSLYVDAITSSMVLKLVNELYANQPMVATISSIANQGNKERLHQQIDWLSGGHPEILRSIIERFEPIPFIDLLSNPVNASEIEEEQQEMVSSFLNCSEEETTLLEFLSLFDGSFEYDAIQELQPKPSKILKRLYRKRLILIDAQNTAIRHYYLPTLIKNYFKNGMSKDDSEIYKSRIGRYFKHKSGV